MNSCSNQHTVRFQLCHRHHVTCERSRSPCMQKSLGYICSEKSFSLPSDSCSKQCKPAIEKLKIIPGFPEPYKKSKIKKKKEKDTEDLIIKSHYEPLYENVHKESDTDVFEIDEKEKMYDIDSLDLGMCIPETLCVEPPPYRPGACTCQSYTPDLDYQQTLDTQICNTAEEEHARTAKRVIDELKSLQLPKANIFDEKMQSGHPSSDLGKVEVIEPFIKENVAPAAKSVGKKKQALKNNSGKKTDQKGDKKSSTKKSKKKMKPKRKPKMMMSFNEDYYEHRGCPGGYKLYNVSFRKNNRWI